MTAPHRAGAPRARATSLPESSFGVRASWWVLRLAVAACFVGHGAFGVIGKSDWLPFFQLVGIGPSAAWWLMLLIGGLDIAVGLSMLVAPLPATLLYAAAWTLWTAALRPLSGLSVWELVERAGNYGVPIALLVWTWDANSRRALFRRIERPSLMPRAIPTANVLAMTTALLLIGHGALALEGKPLLDKHLMLLGLPPLALAAQGWIEISLGLACALTRSRALMLVALAWKIATESLFLVAGAWGWEFVERGGSYGAPLAFALMVGTATMAAAAAGRPAAAARAPLQDRGAALS
ncbi:MAG TPA: hypothetical protein VGP25_15240 [Gemmatimonadaceae bacterium]|nr:hypothetical protein [Gemmatimonadaceae bacterium]